MTTVPRFVWPIGLCLAIATFAGCEADDSTSSLDGAGAPAAEQTNRAPEPQPSADTAASETGAPARAPARTAPDATGRGDIGESTTMPKPKPGQGDLPQSTRSSPPAVEGQGDL